MNVELLEEFGKEIQKIYFYMNHVQSVNKIIEHSLSDNDTEQTRRLLTQFQQNHKSTEFRADKKIFEYKVIIIFIYGVLERFVSIWIGEYLYKVSKIVPYDELSFKENHFEFSNRLISMILEKRWDKYEHLKKEEILEKLNDCLKNPKNYELNTDAFTIQAGNLRHKKICEIFNRLHINLDEYLGKDEHFTNAIGLFEKGIASMEPSIFYAKIDDLVRRRNEIAHGIDVDDILDKSSIEDVIIFMRSYCKALFRALNVNYIEQETKYLYQEIKVVHQVWDRKILGFQIDNYLIKKGDFLIVKDNKGVFYKEQIIEIQVNKKAYDSITVKAKTDITIRTELKIKDNWTFYLVKK